MTLANEAAASGRPALVLALQLVVNFVGRLGEQEQAAAEQNQVAPGDVLTEQRDREQRLGQPRNPENRPEQPDAHHHRGDRADPAGALLLLLRELARQNRDEDDVVDPENNLEKGQGNERNEPVPAWSTASSLPDGFRLVAPTFHDRQSGILRIRQVSLRTFATDEPSCLGRSRRPGMAARLTETRRHRLPFVRTIVHDERHVHVRG